MGLRVGELASLVLVPVLCGLELALTFGVWAALRSYVRTLRAYGDQPVSGHDHAEALREAMRGAFWGWFATGALVGLVLVFAGGGLA